MKYQIWSEGFWATGDYGGATFHGTVEASNFLEACIKYSKEHKIFADNFNQEDMTYWGCKLFDNEQDARRSFG